MKRGALGTAAALALALGVPAGASAQSTTPRAAPPLRGAPPPGAGRHAQPARPASQASAGRRLPKTGGQPGLLAAAGLGLVMTGFGLRLRVPGG